MRRALRFAVPICVVLWAGIFTALYAQTSLFPLPMPIAAAAATPDTSFITGQVLGSPYNSLDGCFGLLFQHSTPVTVTSLGRWVIAGNSGTHVMTLMNSSGTSLANCSVNTSGAPAGAYRYCALSSPVSLSANTSYYLASIEANGGDFFHLGDNLVTPVAGGSVLSAEYGTATGNNCTATPNGGANASYGPVNLKFHETPGSGITFVNDVFYDSGVTSTATLPTPPQNVTSGNLLVVSVRLGGIGSVLTMTDTAGNIFTYAAGSRKVISGATTEIWYATNATGNAANIITATASGSTQFASIMSDQYHRTSPLAFDVAAVSSLTGSRTTDTTDSFTPTGAGELIVAIGSQQVGGGSWTAGPGFALRTNTTSGTQTQDNLNGSAGAQTASMTYSVSSVMNISVAVFK